MRDTFENLNKFGGAIRSLGGVGRSC